MIARVEVDRRVLTALQQKFLADPVAFARFSEAFVAETNRLHAGRLRPAEQSSRCRDDCSARTRRGTATPAVVMPFMLSF